MLRAEQLAMSGGRAPISFAVERGRCLGLLGPTPQHTSHLLLACAALARPVSGRVLINDTDTAANPEAARRQVAVARTQCVDERLHLREYLRAVARGRRAAGTTLRLSVTEMLARLDLDGARALSSPEAQAEAAIAAALLPAVGLVVLDEPFAHLRSETRVRAIEWIRALAADSAAVVIGGREERDLRAVSHTVVATEPAR